MGDESATAAKPNGKRTKPTGAGASSRRRVQLTDWQRQVYELRHSTDPPVPWNKMVKILGKDSGSIRQTYKRALAKLPNEGKFVANPKSFQASNPDRYAEIVNDLTDPEKRGGEVVVAAIAKKLNLPEHTAWAVARQIRSIYFPASVETRNIKMERLKDLWGMRAEGALAQLTPERISEAGPKDLALIAAIATDKLLLLRGQPTQIVRTESDRMKLDVLTKAFLEEAGRRGYAITTNEITGEIDVTHKRFTPPALESEPVDIQPEPS
jgi:hypothetical protein